MQRWGHVGLGDFVVWFRLLFAVQLLPGVLQLEGVVFAIADVATNTAQQIDRWLWQALRCTSVSVC